MAKALEAARPVLVGPVAAITIATSALRDPPTSDESRASGTGVWAELAAERVPHVVPKGGHRSNRSLLGEQQALPRHCATAGDHHGNEGGIGQAGGGQGQGGQEAGPGPRGGGGVERLSHSAFLGKMVV